MVVSQHSEYQNTPNLIQILKAKTQSHYDMIYLTLMFCCSTEFAKQ